MRRASLLIALVVLVPAVARAQWGVGVRTGYSIPLGDGDGSMAMGDVVGAAIPFQLDVDYRTNSQMTLGGYLSYAVGSVAGATQNLCDTYGVSCSASQLRVGFQFAYWLNPQPPVGHLVGPWVGLGIGYESITISGQNDLTISGTEFLIAQAGHDWRIGENGALGVFASFSLGEYSNMSGGGQTAEIADKTMHQWLTFGARGSFGSRR